MEKAPFFSIVVPIYNVGPYLKACIESVVNQKYQDFELLLVDDGSTDCSGIVCETFAKKDSRIKVFHQANKGLSGARNTGIKNAVGKWLLFLDGDDRLTEDALVLWHHEIKKRVDIGIFVAKYEAIDNDGILIDGLGTPQSFCPGLYELSDFRQSVLRYARTAGWAVWKLAVETKCIQQNNLYFCEDINYSEDLYWIFNLFASFSQVLFIDSVVYQYRTARVGAQSGNVNKMMEGVIKTYNLYQYHCPPYMFGEKKMVVLSYLADTMMALIMQGIHLEGAAAEQRNRLIHEHMDVLSYVKRKISPTKRLCVYPCLKLIGLQRTDKLIRTLKQKV